MGHKHNGGFIVSPARIAIIENEIEELFKRVESIEKQIKEDKEEQLKKLKAEADYLKFRCALQQSEIKDNMVDSIFQNPADKEQNNLWMYRIFDENKIMVKIKQWTKEAEKKGMTLTQYLESINPLNKKEKLPWLGKNCKDCGNEKCKRLGTLPKGYDCALWQAKERSDEL